MENNTLLTFKSKAYYNDTKEEDTIEFLTNANLTKKNDKYYVVFNYPESYDVHHSKATLKIENDKVTLLKYGTNCSQFIFEQGQQHKGHYETDFGSLSVGIFSENVSVDLNDEGGDIDLKYTIYFNDLATHHTNLSINLKRI